MQFTLDLVSGITKKPQPDINNFCDTPFSNTIYSHTDHTINVTTNQQEIDKLKGDSKITYLKYKQLYQIMLRYSDNKISYLFCYEIDVKDNKTHKPVCILYKDSTNERETSSLLTPIYGKLPE